MDRLTYNSLRISDNGKSFIPTCAFPEFNLFDLDRIKHEFDFNIPSSKHFDVRFGHHHCLFAGCEPDDVAADLLQKKVEWLNELRVIAPKNPTKAMRQLKAFKTGKTKKLPVRLLLYLKHLEKDPLAGHQGDVNWLFSGSCVTSMPAPDGDSQVVVACGTEKLAGICMLSLNSDGTLKNSFGMPLKVKSPVLQITSNQSSNSPLICVRQKNIVNVLKPSQNLFSVVRKKKVSHPSYFTNVSMLGDVVALAKYKGSVVTVNVETNQIQTILTSSEKNCPLKTGWNKVHLRNDDMVFVTTTSVRVIDPRILSIVYEWGDASLFKQGEEIVNFFDSCHYPHLNYVATTQFLYCLDIRAQNVVRRWSHMLRSPPYFGQTILVGGKEVILLQSHAPDDVVAFINEPGIDAVPPHAVHSVSDSFLEARKKGLGPEYAHRGQFTTIGSHLFKCGGVVRGLTQTAGGDIFLRSVCHEVEDQNFDGIDEAFYNSWKNYVDDREALPNRTPVFREVVDMTEAFKLLSVPGRSQRYPPPGMKNAFENWKYREKFDPKSLVMYKDLLAKRILDVWGIDEPEELNTDELPFDSMDIQDWIKKHQDIDGV